jgi:hypothetical protein
MEIAISVGGVSPPTSIFNALDAFFAAHAGIAVESAECNCVADKSTNEATIEARY